MECIEVTREFVHLDFDDLERLLKKYDTRIKHLKIYSYDQSYRIELEPELISLDLDSDLRKLEEILFEKLIKENSNRAVAKNIRNIIYNLPRQSIKEFLNKDYHEIMKELKQYNNEETSNYNSKNHNRIVKILVDQCGLKFGQYRFIDYVF